LSGQPLCRVTRSLDTGRDAEKTQGGPSPIMCLLLPQGSADFRRRQFFRYFSHAGEGGFPAFLASLLVFSRCFPNSSRSGLSSNRGRNSNKPAKRSSVLSSFAGSSRPGDAK